MEAIMMTDKRSLFSDDQAITASAASSDYYDQGAMGVTANGAQLVRKAGVLQDIPLLVQVTADFNTLTSLQLIIESDDDSAFGSATAVYTSAAIPLASLVAGYTFHPHVLPVIKERYIRTRYVVVGANPTLGNITAGFVAAVDGNLM